MAYIQKGLDACGVLGRLHATVSISARFFSGVVGLYTILITDLYEDTERSMWTGIIVVNRQGIELGRDAPA